MRVQELMAKYSWNDVKDEFWTVCEIRNCDFELDSLRKVLPLYEKAYEDCKKLKAIPSKAVVHIAPLICDGIVVEGMEAYYTNGKKNSSDKEAVHFYKKNMSKKTYAEFINSEMKFAVDSSPRQKSLGMNVDENNIKDLGEKQFIAYLFYFITLWGISAGSCARQVNRIRKVLKERVKDLDLIESIPKKSSV